MRRFRFLLIIVLATVVSAHADQSFDSFLFDEVPEGPRTEALLISQNGKLVYERYARGYTFENRHILWSISKSVTATLIGAAVKDGLLKTTDSLCLGMNPPLSLPSCAVTVADLLGWSSGIEWLEEYEKSGDRTRSSVVQMLAGDGRYDMFKFFYEHPLGAKPGQRYRYSTGDSTALMGILKNVIHDPKVYDRWPWQKLFDPLGMKHVTFEQDNAGTFVGGSYVYMTAPDLIRLGEFWMRAVSGDAQDLIPRDWMKQLLTPPVGFQRPISKKLFFYPLHHFWRPLEVDEKQIPADTFSANGHWGQYVFVIPSLKLVVVRFGDDRNRPFQVKVFFRHLTKHLYGKADGAETPSEGQSSDKPEAHPPAYGTWMPNLGTHYGTRIYCSCRFVVKQSEDYCQEYVKISPDILRVRMQDEVKGETVVSILWFWKAVAQYRSPELGCYLKR